MADAKYMQDTGDVGNKKAFGGANATTPPSIKYPYCQGGTHSCSPTLFQGPPGLFTFQNQAAGIPSTLAKAARNSFQA